MQAAIYSSLIGIKYIDLIDAGYEVKFHFIVIDRNFQVYPFLVSNNTLNSWFTRLTQALEKANWHYINKSYDLPYDFATGRMTL
jgi:hypothetical protein